MKTKENIDRRIKILEAVMKDPNAMPMRKIEADNELHILRWVLRD